MKKLAKYLASMFLLSILLPGTSYAAASDTQMLDLTDSWVGSIPIFVFTIAYATVISEEFLHLRKSKPVIIDVGVIWFLVGIANVLHGLSVRCCKHYDQ